MSFQLVPHLPRLVACGRRTTASDEHADTTSSYISIYSFFEVLPLQPDGYRLFVQFTFLCAKKKLTINLSMVDHFRYIAFQSVVRQI